MFNQSIVLFPFDNFLYVFVSQKAQRKLLLNSMYGSPWEGRGFCVMYCNTYFKRCLRAILLSAYSDFNHHGHVCCTYSPLEQNKINKSRRRRPTVLFHFFNKLSI